LVGVCSLFSLCYQIGEGGAHHNPAVGQPDLWNQREPNRKEKKMKNYFLVTLVLLLSLTLTGVVSAADKEAIKTQVDEIVMAIDGGKAVSDFTDAANRKPYYVYIMEASGLLLVHPSLAGESLKEKAAPAYEAVVQATPGGTWVKYEWKGKEKNAYVRETKSGVIVGSGF
jgi:hypothetical protein